MRLAERFHGLAHCATIASGSSWMFGGSLLACGIWLALGPVCHWGTAWNLWPTAILTWTTWLVLVLVQHEQLVESSALQTKVDELLRAIEPAKNTLIGLEEQSLPAIEQVHRDVVAEAHQPP